jgi:DNA-binding transcriptional ArsR family regulator
MTPALRSELEGLRKTMSLALARLDEILAVPDAAERGRTPAAIVTVLESMGRAMSSREVFDALTCAGREVNEAAVYQTLKRLADAGKVERMANGKYKAKGAKQ